jgi:hypothetical protein
VRAAGRRGSGLPGQKSGDAALLLEHHEREPFLCRDFPILVDEVMPDLNFWIEENSDLPRHDHLGLGRGIQLNF